jgi:predicted molibdopterin-dependent oxidoreductase YjgC
MFKTLPDGALPTVSLFVDGHPIGAAEGETVAAVLLRTPPHYARTTQISGSRRAPYCMMGVCYDCLATVDGVRSTQTCMTLVQDGMRVERQNGWPEASNEQ